MDCEWNSEQTEPPLTKPRKKKKNVCVSLSAHQFKKKNTTFVFMKQKNVQDFNAFGNIVHFFQGTFNLRIWIIIPQTQTSEHSAQKKRWQKHIEGAF